MTAILPLAVWQPGTLQPSTPVNDNALRIEVLQRGAISITSTPPGSPADGDTYILGTAPTGAWSTFAEHDVVLWRSGTWYRFAPFSGWLKQVATEVRRYDGTAWVVVTGGGGGGAVPIQEEGSTVVASPTAINFVGAGVTVTDVGGVATATIPGGGGGGGSGGISTKWRGFVYPNSNSNTPSSFGFAAPNVSGSPSTGVISAASRWQSLPRINYGVSAGTAAVAGFREPQGAFASRFAGFKMRFRMGPSTGAATASHRLFIGMRNTFGGSADANPSTWTDIIGLGYDSGDTNVQIMHNDGSGTATKVDLGASFPKPSVIDSNIYDLTLECAQGSGTVSYSVIEVVSGATASGTITADLPALTTLMMWWSQMSAGGTSTGITITFFGLDFESGE